MEYESYKQHLSDRHQELASAVGDWTTLACVALEAIENACRGETVDLHALKDAKASFASEAGFLRSLPDRIEEFRKEVRGLKRFYAPESIQRPSSFQEEPAKGGWFGLKRTAASAVAEIAPAPAAEAHSDQRAFTEARSQMAALDRLLDTVRDDIAKTTGDSEEIAYRLKTEVVSLNAQIRADSDTKKRESRRFFLEEAVGILSERTTQLGLHARAVGRLHSSEYVENPFEI
jgi:hypothetical protein